jgi:hypothetical protein
MEGRNDERQTTKIIAVAPNQLLGNLIKQYFAF